uniref:Lipoprotein-releasing system ATP-binding protein lolD n=1 Tax=Magnetococcus massalia (strain MO-1) TaxID=451514 RepID=A0A1S7LGC8_MAGMO|nr:Lipoprotein-releasing system ATP-binding protein lolD [Candidatus Magnetococcus massalia]
MSDAVENQSPLLVAEGISRHFKTEADRVEVLRGVDLTLGRGETVAMVGASGSGKSTLIQILGTLDHPSEGSLRFDGINPFALSSKKQAALRNNRIAFIYQLHRLLPEFTALENVQMPLLIGRMNPAEAKERAAGMLQRVGLADRLKHKPGQLSGGQQQRVAIARALINEPDLLLADEPTGNLDTHTAEEVFELLLELNSEKLLTALVVTHNPELARRMDRTLTMVDGRVEESGSV